MIDGVNFGDINSMTGVEAIYLLPPVEPPDFPVLRGVSSVRGHQILIPLSLSPSALVVPRHRSV